MNGIDLGLIAIAMALIAISASRGRQQQDAYLQRRLDALMEHLGVDPDALVREEVTPLLRANRKMAAMRIYRQRTGADHVTAQRVVEGWMAQVAREMADGAGRPAGG
jgi:hypothetical protein